MSKSVSKTALIDRKLLADNRGWFLKVIDGNEQHNPFGCEVYFTSAKPGESRGGHYHLLANEWFTMIQGKASLKLFDTRSGELFSLDLDCEKPSTVFVPAGIAHIFINCGKEDFLLVAYTDKKYHPEDTIPYSF
jgi:dTDP-4-dehydrorhamnose 3,5-epimerase-like enzyme